MRTLLVILLGLPAGLGGNARQDGTWQKYENGNWQAAQTPQSERARAQTAKSPPAPPQPRTRAERQGGLQLMTTCITRMSVLDIIVYVSVGAIIIFLWLQ